MRTKLLCRRVDGTKTRAALWGNMYKSCTTSNQQPGEGPSGSSYDLRDKRQLDLGVSDGGKIDLWSGGFSRPGEGANGSVEWSDILLDWI